MRHTLDINQHFIFKTPAGLPISREASYRRPPFSVGHWGVFKAAAPLGMSHYPQYQKPLQETH